MEKTNSNSLSPFQYSSLIVGCIIGPSLLKMSNLLVKDSKQHAWIANLFGALYPLIILILGNYIIKKHPNKNIIDLNKKYLGKILGNILNVLFLSQYLYFFAGVSTDLVSLSMVYITGFLTPVKIILLILFVTFYAASKNLSVLGKINELSVYLLIVMLILSLFSLKKASILNIQPIAIKSKEEFFNILKSTNELAYSYSAMETMVVFHPFVKQKDKIKKASIQSFLILTITWVWGSVVTILYLGIDFISKSHWPFVFVYQSITIPIINNFMYVFMFIWSILIFRMLSNYIFVVNLGLSQIFNLKTKFFYIIFIPLDFLLCLLFTNLKFKINFTTAVSTYMVIFNILYILNITLFSIFHHDKQKIHL